MCAKTCSFICVFCSLVLLVGIACTLGGGAPAAEPGGVSPTSTSLAALPPTAPANPTMPATFTITLPDGSTVALTLVRCTGTSPGQYLDLAAANSDDLADPGRIEVKVAGNQQGPGMYEGFYIEVTIGAKDAWDFLGNTPAAQVTLETGGRGHFREVPIVNAASNSARYPYGNEFIFSGTWVCP